MLDPEIFGDLDPKKKCSWPTCKKKRGKRSSLCPGHASRKRYNQPMDPPIKKMVKSGGQCQATALCDRVAKLTGYCTGHYNKKRKMKGAAGWDAPLGSKPGEAKKCLWVKVHVPDQTHQMISVQAKKLKITYQAMARIILNLWAEGALERQEKLKNGRL